MLQLHCTQKVRKQFGIDVDSHDSKPSNAALGNWYVNLGTIDRRKTLIFMSERTLLSFLLFGVKKQTQVSLADLFVRGLAQLLELEEFTEPQIHRAMGVGGHLQYSKTGNRKALGNLNDLQQLYTITILNEGGFSHCDLWAIIRKMNRMPQRNIGWAYSIELARDAIAA
jgi:hypothetical protein